MSDKKKPMEKKVIEPTIKSVTNCVTCGSECDVNTDGTTHYYVSKTERFKTELKEAVDILDCFSRFDDEETDEKRLMYYEIIRKDAKAFLTKHKSKE